uniref:Uncharacterized protein n=1 Tax=Globodera rostochiensis TaxID=31243 RepID=A0A914HTX6_GLORO
MSTIDFPLNKAQSAEHQSASSESLDSLSLGHTSRLFTPQSTHPKDSSPGVLSADLINSKSRRLHHRCTHYYRGSRQIFWCNERELDPLAKSASNPPTSVQQLRVFAAPTTACVANPYFGKLVGRRL